MDLWKCLDRAPISRGPLRIAFLSLVWAAAGEPLRAQPVILPPDAAVNAYEQGRQAVRKGNYAVGIEKLKEALATGHTDPKEHFGTSRNFTDWYDPYYWLGVAQMETGDDGEALGNLRRSRSAGVIERWPEFRNLLERLDTLESRAAVRKLAGEQRIVLPTPAPSPPPQLPAAVPARPPEPTATAAPAPVRTAPAEVRPADLEALIASLSAGSWTDAERALARIRAQAPEAPEADLLEAVLAGTRWVLEGGTEAQLLERARRSLHAYRRRGGSRRAEDVWISPSLARALKD